MKNNKQSKRFFVVFYSYSNGSNLQGTGNICTTRDNFINQIEFTDDREKFLFDTYKHNFKIVITNIIELSKEDYEQYIKYNGH